MNPLREMIVNELIKPEISSANKTYLGTVQSYDSKSRTATILVGENNSGTTYENVPFSEASKEVFGKDPTMGTIVIVSFLQASMTHPYVVSIIKIDAFDQTPDDGSGKEEEEDGAQEAEPASSREEPAQRVALPRDVLMEQRMNRLG